MEQFHNIFDMNEDLDYRKKYEELRNMINSALSTYLPDVDERSSILKDSMLYSLNAGGKRLRPILLMASSQLFSSVYFNIENVDENNKENNLINSNKILNFSLPFACAIEFIHTYSLIHDDHPSMDNDDMRRGKPTNHKVFGDAMAILSGDGLLNSAFDVMLKVALSETNKENFTRCISAAFEISQAAGVRGMIAGQVADWKMTSSNRENNLETTPNGQVPLEKLSEKNKSVDIHDMLQYIHENKTGALIRAAVRAGAILGGGTGKALEEASTYAYNVGLAFQIVDDLLDVTGDADIMGKDLGVDCALGKLTYTALYGIDKSREMVEKLTEEAVAALHRLGDLLMLELKEQNYLFNFEKLDSDSYLPLLLKNQVTYSIKFFTELALDLKQRIK